MTALETIYEQGMGTILTKDFFTSIGNAESPDLEDPDFQKLIEERDSEIGNLEIDLYKRAGLMENDQLYIRCDGEVFPNNRQVPQEGWALFIESDDFTTALFHNGQPMAGMYVTFRGNYQAGGYLVNPETHLYAHDMPGVFGRSETTGEWEEDEGNTCSKIAHDFLLGKGLFSDEEDEEEDGD